jgi:hypothetical protein
MKRGTLLHGWLFTATRYAAANALKMRKRRTHHERVAAGMRSEAVEPEPVEAVTPLLDEALADLREPDRCAVLLSYFGGKTYREVGAEIGTSEEGARKRVQRAVNRMRQFFAKRGVAVTGAAVVATLKHSASAAVPPPGLVESILTCMAAPTVSGASVGALAKGVIHMMTWGQLKIAGAMTAIVLTTLVGAGAAMLNHTSTMADDKTAPPPAAAVVELTNDVKVELLGVSVRRRTRPDRRQPRRRARRRLPRHRPRHRRPRRTHRAARPARLVQRPNRRPRRRAPHLVQLTRQARSRPAHHDGHRTVRDAAHAAAHGLALRPAHRLRPGRR